LLISYLFRKPTSNVSIERYFNDVIKALPASYMGIANLVPFYGGKNVFGVLINIFWAISHQSRINHITGDIHYIALFLRKKKTIMTIHDCYSLRYTTGIKHLLIKYFWYKIPSRRVKAITVISEATKKELLEYIEIPPEMIKIVPVCISPFFKNQDKPFNAVEPRILQVGTRKNKNLENHACALKGISCHLRIIGNITNEQKEILNDNSINYSIVQNISDSQLIEEYNNSDMLLFASIYEGFGMPIIEAQAVGRPVITSNVTSMPEVAGGAAEIVNPYDSDSIRAGILKIINNKEFRDLLVNKGIKNAKRYTPKAIAAQYSSIYNKISIK